MLLLATVPSPSLQCEDVCPTRLAVSCRSGFLLAPERSEHTNIRHSRPWRDTPRNENVPSKAAATRVRSRHGPPPSLLAHACAYQHGLLGHLARHPARPAHPVMCCRGCRWWRTMQLVADAEVLRSGWSHPRSGWHRAAESALEEWAGAEWTNAALNRAEWARGRGLSVACCGRRFCLAKGRTGRRTERGEGRISGRYGGCLRRR